MFKVYDVRGTHGSGKSYIPINLLSSYEHRPIVSKPITYPGFEQVLGYHIPFLNLYILGRYETACGGCDGIKTQEEIKARVDVFRKVGNVLLEGILVAHTYGPWLEFSEGRNWVFLFNDTPLQVCIDRVNARRDARGQGPLLDPVNIVRDHKTTNGLHQRFLDAGREVHWIKHDQPILPQFLEIYHGK